MSDDKHDDNGESPELSRRGVLGGALGAGATLATLSAGLGASTSALAGSKHDATLPDHPQYKFAFINHVTTNPFFVPTQYGAADACAAFGCTYQWTGSQKSKSSVMVNHMNSAIAAGVDGIAVSLVDQQAFSDPINRALDKGIPVVSYNADADNNRLAYIGQKLFEAGKLVGQRIADQVDSGDVVGFIATPGQLNIQPRMDGAKQAIEASGKDIRFHQVASGPTLNEEINRVESYYVGHTDVKGMFAVDGGSTAAVGKTMAKHGLADKGVVSGGFDMLPQSLRAIDSGDLGFTIDQQPYLQGFFPVAELFLWNLSGGLSGIAEMNTGLKFVTQDNVQSYLKTKTRFQGSSSDQKILETPDSISV
ncbi:sugar ABC transporter substrate-binding protein [Salinisphaera sp. USBA-960]|uniref:sugar ABC transporter substrate-binding protein n=1 Tax=Salinisphaera orenii TaxID=856731 RepID=UPI000DBE3A03|nr:sugar ABC transporter substrate-binding protein [Salifodinibacter halophilus]NNC25817.1 sugar ABC transporter substrate-binding protein [Salifodinibacter halophilus]